ncbi:hypothetical protein FQN49_005416, partial [Arthroderma sp. PD_2]
MTSKSSISGLASRPHPAEADAQPIVLHVVSPSFDAQRRITFNDLPLSTTISEVKAKITKELPSRPPPENQRLIYRGKPLSDNNEVLSRIIEPSDTLVYSMHLVLPPSTAAISSFESRAGLSSSRAPYDNDSSSSRGLLYRGPHGSNDNNSRRRPAGHATSLGDDTAPRIGEQEQAQSQSQDRSADSTTPLSHQLHQLDPTTGIRGRTGHVSRTTHESRSSTTFASQNNPGSTAPAGSPLVLNRPQSQPPQTLSEQQQPVQSRRSHLVVPEPPQLLPTP